MKADSGFTEILLTNDHADANLTSIISERNVKHAS